MTSRLDRITQAVKKELGEIIQRELKDPRVPDFTSVVSVKVTKDLKEAVVNISVYGTEKQKTKCLEALNSAQGFIRKELGTRLSIRYTPKLTFIRDDSIEYGAHMHKIFNRLKEEEKNKDENHGSNGGGDQ